MTFRAIFTDKHARQYGLTGDELESLNAAWWDKAASLALDERMPEFWQEAKRFLDDQVAGRNLPPLVEDSGLDEAAAFDLPSLEVDMEEGGEELQSIAGDEERVELGLLDLEGFEESAEAADLSKERNEQVVGEAVAEPLTEADSVEPRHEETEQEERLLETLQQIEEEPGEEPQAQETKQMEELSESREAAEPQKSLPETGAKPPSRSLFAVFAARIGKLFGR